MHPAISLPVRISGDDLRRSLRTARRRAGEDAPRWREMRKLPPPRPFAELAYMDADTDTVRADPGGLRTALTGPRPTRYPVLSVPMTLHGPLDDPQYACEGRWQIALDAENRVCVWRTVIYRDGKVSVKELYRGPNARLATGKLNDDRQATEWANAYCAKAPRPEFDPVDARDVQLGLRRMRAWAKSQRGALVSAP